MPEAKARVTVTDGPSVVMSRDRARSKDTILCKEFSITDDMMNVADSASFTVPNIDGANSGKFKMGARVEIEESHPDVAGGDWVKAFTGRVTQSTHRSETSSGSEILVTCMDLGWHLTSCDAKPLTQIEGIRLKQLIQKLVDSSWGFAGTDVEGATVTDNVLNKVLKQGRAGVQRAFQREQNATAILPYIQVEPGQKPFDVLREYLVREGLLLNVSARGEIVLFRPDFSTESLYDGVFYYPSSDSRAATKNNVSGGPTLTENIDGLYSSTQCWSTIVNPDVDQERTIANNPNAVYRHSSYQPDTNPLPFNRLGVTTDGEAITIDMRDRRARYKWQLDAFNSWKYEVTLRGHAQNGAFFVSDTMISVDDAVHGVSGSYYVQSVQRSLTDSGGEIARLVLRKPLLDPDLQAQRGGGARRVK